MKKLFILFSVLSYSLTLAQYYPHLSELRGLEDSQNNSHLFYRYVFPSTGCWSKSIYHFDIVNSIDTFFIMDSGYEIFPGWGCEGDYVNDYEFFNNDPSKFIYCGYNMWIDPVALLRRYDGDIYVEAFALTQIEISEMNDSLVYVSGGPGFFKSTDGGYNFVRFDSMQFIDESIISLSKNNESQIYGVNEGKLVRSEDDGSSYIIVDSSMWRNDSKLFYDPDADHIYGRSVRYNFSTQSYISNIYKSTNNGNPFTWSVVVESPGKVWFTNDEIIPGEIYYSLQKNIFRSTDYGNSFHFYKQLDQNITGLYKKSGTNILYVSTPLKIYKITPDSANIIKSLPVPGSEYAWFPLNLDDKWIYNNTFYGDVGDSIRWISVNEVTGYRILDEKVYNELTVNEIPIDPGGNSGIHIECFRVDSVDGKIYKAGIENDSLLYEELYMDLLVEVGDTIPIGNGIYLESEVNYTIFGLDSRKRTFAHVLTPALDLRVVKNLGLIFQYVWELVGVKTVLKGCIIDGEVYGDTTVVSVDDELPVRPNEFFLFQNYPNPFNPNTKIKFTIPNVETHRDASLQMVTLKVYDVLGNEIATLVNEELSAGEYEVEFNATSLPSGIYFYQLKAGSFIQTKKMILLK